MKTFSISAARSRGSILGVCTSLLAGILMTGAIVAPVQAHHSFAMFDSSVERVFTGVVVRVNPDVNHLQLFFAEMNEERTNVIRDDRGQPIVWVAEMTSAALAARQGITVNSLPPRTIISLAMNPLRSGEPGGHRVGPLIKCPENTPPESGMHCDSVEGHTAFGEGVLPAGTRN